MAPEDELSEERHLRFPVVLSGGAEVRLVRHRNHVDDRSDLLATVDCQVAADGLGEGLERVPIDRLADLLKADLLRDRVQVEAVLDALQPAENDLVRGKVASVWRQYPDGVLRAMGLALGDRGRTRGVDRDEAGPSRL